MSSPVGGMWPRHIGAASNALVAPGTTDPSSRGPQRGSLHLGRDLYEHYEDNHRFFADRAGYQIIARNLMKNKKRKELNRYIQVVQRSFNLDTVEVYTPNAQRVAISARGDPPPEEIPAVTSQRLRQNRNQKNVSSITVHSAKGDYYRTIASIPIEAGPVRRGPGVRASGGGILTK